MMIMAPRDENELQHMLCTALEHDGPAAVRYPRGEGHGVEMDEQPQAITPGQAEMMFSGDKVLLIAAGSRVYPAQQAAEKLSQEGISCGLINARFIKPLDRELLLETAPGYDCVLTVEEQVLKGGFGNAVLELFSEELGSQFFASTEFARIGLPDEFIPQGDSEEIRREYGLDSEGIVNKVKSLLQNSSTGDFKRSG